MCATLYQLDIQDEPGGEQQPSLKAGRSEQMPRGRLRCVFRAGCVKLESIYRLFPLYEHYDAADH